MIHETCGHNPVMQSDGRCVACDAYERGKNDGFARGLLEAGARWARQVIQTKAALEARETELVLLRANLKEARESASPVPIFKPDMPPVWSDKDTTSNVIMSLAIWGSMSLAGVGVLAVAFVAQHLVWLP